MATGLPVFFGYALMGVAPVAIVLLHHAVEGVFALAFFTDDKVETKCGQCAFLIIADDGVGAVFVLFVELVPCAETGLGKCLFQTALCLLDACDALCKQGEVGFGADGFASGKKEVVVVGGNAFKCPKLLGVVFLVEVVRCE